MTNTLLPTPTNPFADLAVRVAADGIAAHHDAVVAAVAATDIAARFPVLTDLVVDSTAPPVARERALGRLAAVATTQIAPARTAPTAIWHAHAA